jgi:hypothetical protein
LPQLLERVERYLNLGYQRIKLKIKPGWDLDVVAEVRRQYPDILLSVDANSAYTIDDRDHLKKLDDFNLLMIEQPLQNDDVMDHARLQELMNTRLCLDESIVGQRQANCPRTGKLSNNQHQDWSSRRLFGALAIHDLCRGAEDTGLVRRHARIRNRPRAQHCARKSQRFYFAG